MISDSTPSLSDPSGLNNFDVKSSFSIAAANDGFAGKRMAKFDGNKMVDRMSLRDALQATTATTTPSLLRALLGWVVDDDDDDDSRAA